MKQLMFLFVFVFIATSIAVVIKFNNNRYVTKMQNIPVPAGRVLQYGLYELVRGGSVVDSKVTSTGKAVSKPVIQKIKQTERVALKKDAYFAYQYRLSHLAVDKPMVNLTRVLKHPEMTLPDGKKISRSEYTVKVPVKQGEVFAFDGYAFNEDYEMVEGDWIFQIWYQGNKLIEKKFTSYKVTEM